MLKREDEAPVYFVAAVLLSLSVSALMTCLGSPNCRWRILLAVVCYTFAGLTVLLLIRPLRLMRLAVETAELFETLESAIRALGPEAEPRDAALVASFIQQARAGHPRRKGRFGNDDQTALQPVASTGSPSGAGALEDYPDDAREFLGDKYKGRIFGAYCGALLLLLTGALLFCFDRL